MNSCYVSENTVFRGLQNLKLAAKFAMFTLYFCVFVEFGSGQ